MSDDLNAAWAASQNWQKECDRAEKRIVELEKVLEDAVNVINKTNGIVCGFTNGSGMVGERFRAVWNENAGFLSRHQELQTKFLERLKTTAQQSGTQKDE